MPKLWNLTVEAHKSAVRTAILDTAAELVASNGLSSVTMSQIAQQTGIGRATLYKYFAGVEEILMAWHERQIHLHLSQLAGVRQQAHGPAEKLQAVLEAYALIAFEHHGTDLAVLLHQGERVIRAHQELNALIRDLVAEAIESGDLPN